MKEKLWTKNFIITCLTYLLLTSSFQLLMPTIPLYLSEVLGVETSKIGIVMASYGLGLLLIRSVAGYMVDVHSRKPLLILGMALFVSVFAGYYFVVTILLFVTIRFIHGIFWGLSTVSINTVAIDIIPASRRAEGVGFFGVNMNIALAIAPFIAVEIYEASGFKTMISFSLIVGGLSILMALLIKTPKKEHHSRKPAFSFDRFILIEAVPILLNQLLVAFGIGTLIAFAVLYGKDIGIKSPGLFFLFVAGGNILSRVNTGKLVDRGYAHQVITIAILVTAVGFAGFAIFHNVYFFLISAFIIGLGQGTIFPALQTLYVNMAPPSKRGTANSTFLTGMDIGIGLGMLVAAYIADMAGYANMYLATAVISLIAAVIYWFNSRKVYDKYKLTEK